jgi:transcription antitermination factor NusA-like protein
MLSLAIGREGQNARLAAKLTGWRIDIRSDQAAAATPAETARDVQDRATPEPETAPERGPEARPEPEAGAAPEPETRAAESPEVQP